MTLAPTSEAPPAPRIEEDLLGDLEKHGLRDGNFGENQPKLFFLLITHQARPFLFFYLSLPPIFLSSQTYHPDGQSWHVHWTLKAIFGLPARDLRCGRQGKARR